MKEPETKMEKLKEKLELGDKLDDLGIEAPSMDINEYLRILRLARKPTKEEFLTIAKVSMAGIGMIGMIGFIIYVLLTEIPRAF
jgi:protein transport protein SEC61 subunit gamma-like protein